MIQGTEEWFAAKRGIPSASQFDKIITTRREPSKQRQKYLYRLAGERITGTSEETYQSEAMTRGVAMEAEARETYSFITGNPVEETGFLFFDNRLDRGCSPDGLVLDGGLEIKCPTMAVHVEYLLAGKLPTDYYQQVHGSMYITGRAWWDFMSFYPGMKPLIIRVERNEDFCKALDMELDKFCQELDAVVAAIS